MIISLPSLQLRSEVRDPGHFFQLAKVVNNNHKPGKESQKREGTGGLLMWSLPGQLLISSSKESWIKESTEVYFVIFSRASSHLCLPRSLCVSMSLALSLLLDTLDLVCGKTWWRSGSTKGHTAINFAPGDHHNNLTRQPFNCTSPSPWRDRLHQRLIWAERCRSMSLSHPSVGKM